MNLEKTYLWQMSERLIGIDTVSFKSNSKAASLVANELNDLGFRTHIDSYDDHGIQKEQVVAWIGPEVEGGLILSGHLDTVPFENQSGWTKDALKLELIDDKIYGRGTCDMKVFAAHCLDAFKNLNLNKLTKPLVCIFTSDEEIGCVGAHRLTSQLGRILDTMPVPRRAVIGEPTELGIINTHKGIVQFDVIISGVAGHSSRPDLGKNSIELARFVIKSAHDLNEEFSKIKDHTKEKEFPDFPFNHLHLAQIKGGEAPNIIPNSCELKFSYRYFPSDDPVFLFKKFETDLKKQFPELSHSIVFKLKRITKAMPLSFDSELERELIALSNANLTSVAYATDGGEFSTMGIKSYICGAGSIKQAHMPDEFIELDQFLKGTNFIQKLIQNLLT